MSATPEEIDADIEEIVSTPINVLEDNEDIEVSVIDDVPEEDRNRPARAECWKKMTMAWMKRSLASE